MLISFEIICYALVVLWIYFLWSRRKYYKLIFTIGGPLGYPLLGMGIDLMKREEILDAIEELEKKYGSLIFSWLGPLPFIIVSEPVLIQEIFNSPHTSDKAAIYEAVTNGVGAGLFSLNGPTYTLHRKLLNPAFSHKVLLSFIKIFNEETDKFITELDEWNNRDAFDIIPLLQMFTYRTATRTTMGKNFKVQDTEIAELLKSYRCCLEIMAEMTFCPWLQYKIGRILFGKDKDFERSKYKTRRFIQNIIQDKMEHPLPPDASETEKNIFLNLGIDLIKTGKLSKQEVEIEANGIVFGAYETTSNTLSYIFMLLAMHPHYQQKLYEEIESVFHDKDDDELTYADIQKLVYTEMVLNESMRVIPPVPIVSRKVTKDITLSNQVVIPEGVQIAINMYSVHRNKDIWGPEAHLFNPDNFLPSNLSGKHSYSFLPFTKGTRTCIGMKYSQLAIKVTLAKVLRKYRFSTDFRYEDLQLVEDVTMKLKHIPWLKLEAR